MTRRQLCSVESAALHNPHLNVIVFVSTDPVFTRFTSGVAPPQDDFRDCESTRKIGLVPNVRFVYKTMLEFLNGTALYDWFNTGTLMKSEYSMFHAGDGKIYE